MKNNDDNMDLQSGNQEDNTTEIPEDDSLEELDEVSKLQNEIEELKDRLLRVVAEGENTRKRFEKMLSDTQKYSIADFSKELIPVLDIFDKAFDSLQFAEISNDNIKVFIEGIQMTQKVLEKALNKYGVVSISPLGEKFDPNFHETLFAKPDPDKEEGIVSDVLEVGYKIHDRILRSAKVGIVKNEKC